VSQSNLPTDDEVLAYLMGEHDGLERPRGATHLDDLRELLADPAMWQAPPPGLGDRVVSAVAVAASTAPAPEPLAASEVSEQVSPEQAAPGVVLPLRRRVARRPAAVAVAASLVLGMALGVNALAGDGAGPDEQALAPQAQAVRLPAPGAPSVEVSAREIEGMSTEGQDELFGLDEFDPALGRFPGLVYWLTPGPDGSTRLSRQISTFFDKAGRANGAMRAMLIRRPADPDERNPWPAGSDAQVDIHPAGGEAGSDYPAGTAVVYLNAAALNATTSADVARMAVQQVAWTLTANDPTIKQVVLTAADSRARQELESRGLWGSGVMTNSPTAPGNPVEVLAPVQIDGPTEDAELKPGLFAVSGAAVAPDGRVRWQVLSRGQIVREGTAEVDGSGLAPYVFRLELQPGNYTVSVFPGEGSEGAASRVFRVHGLPV
jgi:hypothetical protein